MFLYISCAFSLAVCLRNIKRNLNHRSYDHHSSFILAEDLGIKVKHKELVCIKTHTFVAICFHKIGKGTKIQKKILNGDG